MRLFKLYITAAMGMIVTCPLLGQDSVPIISSITQSRTENSAEISYSPSTWDQAINLFLMQARMEQPPEAPKFPRDSIRLALELRARQWLRTVANGDVSGLQLEPYSKLLIAGGQEEAGVKILEQRLKSPGLVAEDSAYAFNLAIEAFADGSNPTKMAIAERYVVRLDSLGERANYWKYQAYSRLSRANFIAGNKEKFISYAKSAIELVPKLFFKSRGLFYYGDGDMYVLLCDALKSEGRISELEPIDTRLKDATFASPTLAGLDSSFVYGGRSYARSLRLMQSLAARLGTPAPQLAVTSWLNITDTTKRGLSLNDGKVRIIGIGQRAHALYYLPAFERVLAEVGSKAEAIFIVSTSGYWGREFLTPDEETAKLKEYFTLKRPTTIPLAVWAGPKVTTRNGGFKPAISSTMSSLGISSGGTIAIIVDGKGNIRRIFPSSFNRTDESFAASVIKNILSGS